MISGGAAVRGAARLAEKKVIGAFGDVPHPETKEVAKGMPSSRMRRISMELVLPVPASPNRLLKGVRDVAMRGEVRSKSSTYSDCVVLRFCARMRRVWSWGTVTLTR